VFDAHPGMHYAFRIMVTHVKNNSNRRAFLKLAALGTGLSVSGGCRMFSHRREKTGKTGVAGAEKSRSPLKFGFIGVGGIGRKHLSEFSSMGVNVAALCDVDERELYGARDMLSNKHPSARLYKDFRVMLQNNPGMDAVVIATPDHGHGIQAALSLRAGCHVFLETPLAHTLEELDILETEAARAEKIIMPGDCGCMHEEALRAHEVISTDVLGKISEVHVWTSGPIWPQGGPAPSGSDPVPETLDWQLWLSGAKPRSFKRYAYHKFNWRGWTDFGSGTPGDIGCRLLGFPFKVLKLEAPGNVQRLFHAGGTELSYPRSTELHFQCESKAQKRPVDLFWYDGGRMPRAELLSQVEATLGKLPGTGTLIIGEQGSWFVSGAKCKQHYIGLNGGRRMVDLEKHDLWTSAPKFLPRNGSACELFLRAVRNSKGYDFKINAGKALNQAVLVGAVAQRMDGLLNWNAKKGRFIRTDEACELIKPHLETEWKYY